MNPTIDLLLKRKSVRAYTDQPVPDAEKELILRAAMQAPTAGNMMLYSIIEVADQTLKDRLAVTCDNQPFIARAPFLLLFLADYQRWFDYYIASGAERLCQRHGELFRKPAEGDLLLACCDTLIAAHAAVIAAESLGIGSCYIGDIIEQYEIHRELFDLPPYVLPVTLICFGYPTPEQAARSQPARFERRFIVQRDHYHRLNNAELEEMFRPRNEQMQRVGPRQDGIENAGQFNYVKKFSADFTLEMTRSVQQMLKSWITGE